MGSVRNRGLLVRNKLTGTVRAKHKDVSPFSYISIISVYIYVSPKKSANKEKYTSSLTFGLTSTSNCFDHNVPFVRLFGICVTDFPQRFRLLACQPDFGSLCLSRKRDNVSSLGAL